MNRWMVWALRLRAFWKREWKFMGMALAGGLLVCLLWSGVYAARIQAGIADGVVRFHVLANSDTAADQSLKIQVRDAVLESVGKGLEDCASKGESLAFLAGCQQEIAETAAAEIAAAGYDYPVSVSLVREDFPEKTYGSLVFPAGVYDAVRIEIGAAQGQNWWCVLYPQMCYVDAAWGEPTAEGREKLRQSLTAEEYAVISAAEQSTQTPKIKLKIVEMWQGA